MQQAEGQSGVVSVAQAQLAGGRFDAYVGTNTVLRLWAQGLDSGLRERISQWWTVREQDSECCVRSLGLVSLRPCIWVSEGIAPFLFAEPSENSHTHLPPKENDSSFE